MSESRTVKLKNTLVIMMCVLLFSGCGVQMEEEVKSVKEEISTLTDEISNITDEISTIVEEKDNPKNIAFFIIDKDTDSNVRCQSISIINVDVESKNMKVVNISDALYLNIGNDSYNPCWGAYYKGGYKQMISTLNQNLDMNIEDYLILDVENLSELSDALGGLELPENQDLDNIQLVSVLCDKMKSVDEATLDEAIDIYLKCVRTSIDEKMLLEGIKNVSGYTIVAADNFPQEDMQEEYVIGSKGTCSVPTDLEANVIWLHEFLLGQGDYQVSDTVKKYSAQIIKDVARYAQ